MISVIKRLQVIKDKLNSGNTEGDLIKLIMSGDYPLVDEFDSLISHIIKQSFEAGNEEGRKKAAGVGWTQAVMNSNQQAERLAPLIQEFRRSGIDTLQAIADELNDRGIKTKTGHQWYPSSVKLVVERMKEIKNKERSL